MSYDDNGNVKKENDHSFDSLLYAVSYYGEIDDQSAFWSALHPSPTLKPVEVDIEPEEGITFISDGVELIDDFEEWHKKHKWEKTETSPDDEFPWGEGIDIWHPERNKKREGKSEKNDNWQK
jgi:hypothetical protein